MDVANVSSREAEVLAALGSHLSNAQIAGRLHISVRTVESHVSALLRKLDAPNRQALAALADQARVGRFAGLPTSRTTFVGRSADLAALLDALDDTRLVTLIGPGGVGKTRLAAVAAAEAATRFPAGGAFVDLVPARPGSVRRAVADALEVTEAPSRSLERGILERLRVGRPLLVLDNCEHVIDDASDLVEQVLSECPHATVLVTTRQRLGVTGERLVQLSPLKVMADAEQLFLDRARNADPEFDAPSAVVRDLCSRLDGVPLAIELAAARAPSLGADGLLAALDDRLLALSGLRGAHVRHHSLRAVVGWSYDLLEADERAIFRRLSMFVGGFDLDAATAVGAASNRAVVADIVGRLVDGSLVVRHSRGRWRMLDTIRAFGMSQLVALEEMEHVSELYRRWARGVATELEGRLDTDWQAAFDEVAADLRMAATSPPAEHDLLRTLAHLTFARGRFAEAAVHFRAAAECATDAGSAVRDLLDAADSSVVVGNNRGGLDAALEAVERSGAAEPRARAVTMSVRWPAEPNPLPRQRREDLLAEATAAADAADRRLQALIATAAAWHTGIGPTADLERSRAAAELAREAGDPTVLAGALDALWTAVAQRGSIREAHQLATERLCLAETLPRHEPAPMGEIIDAFHVAAAAAIGAGDLPAALDVALRSPTEDPIGGHPYIWAPRVVRVLALTGRFDEAVQHAQTLWNRWHDDGAPPPWMASAFAAAAMVHGLRGDERYGLWRERSLAVAGGREASEAPGLAAALAFVDARVAIHCGSPAAGDLVESAFASFPERWWTGYVWVGYARSVGAELAVLTHRADAAERLAAAAPFAAENQWAAACQARARGRLGDRAALLEAVDHWTRLGARFERACTLMLIPEGADEGIAELGRLGCPTPAI